MVIGHLFLQDLRLTRGRVSVHRFDVISLGSELDCLPEHVAVFGCL